MKRTVSYLNMNYHPSEWTVCDTCGRETHLPELKGWQRYVDTTRTIRDICPDCLLRQIEETPEGGGVKISMSHNPQEGMNPCPFCGVPAKAYLREGSSIWGIWHDEKGCPIREWDFYPPKYKSREAAIAAWNTLITVPKCLIHNEREKS